MPFTIRPYRRVPTNCPVTYQTGLFEGYGTVWNLSLTGWQFSGDMPLRVGEVCSLTVNLSIVSLPPRRGVVDAVLFLESAPFVTGKILHAGGGQSAGH